MRDRKCDWYEDDGMMVCRTCGDMDIAINEDCGEAHSAAALDLSALPLASLDRAMAAKYAHQRDCAHTPDAAPNAHVCAKCGVVIAFAHVSSSTVTPADAREGAA